MPLLHKRHVALRQEEPKGRGDNTEAGSQRDSGIDVADGAGHFCDLLGEPCHCGAAVGDAESWLEGLPADSMSALEENLDLAMWTTLLDEEAGAGYMDAAAT